MIVNNSSLRSSEKTRSGSRKRSKSYRRRKERPSSELHWGINVCKAHAPHVGGGGSPIQSLFQPDGRLAPKKPILPRIMMIALAGALTAPVVFALLMHPVGYALLGSAIVFFPLRGFRLRSRNRLELPTQD
jgi:hypothetical protein